MSTTTSSSGSSSGSSFREGSNPRTSKRNSTALSTETYPKNNFRPRARYGHSLTLLGDRILLIAGTVYHEYFNDVWEYNLKTNEWKIITVNPSGKLPSPRFGHTVTLLPDGKSMLLFGGSNNSVWSCDTYLFNTESLEWSEVPCDVKPSERRGHSMVQIGQLIYLYGGQSANSQKDVWSFNPETMTWSEVVPALTTTCIPEARYCHSSVPFGDYMVVWGGHGSWGCVPPILYAFNTKTHEWSQWETHGIPPCARFGHAALCVGHRMVVFGGMDVYPTGTSFNDMHVLDMNTLVWQEVSLSGSIPRGRRLHGVCDLGHSFLVFGGWNGNELFDDAFEIRLEPLSLKDLIGAFVIQSNIPYEIPKQIPQ